MLRKELQTGFNGIFNNRNTINANYINVYN
jgi:hypothetical protein